MRTIRIFVAVVLCATAAHAVTFGREKAAAPGGTQAQDQVRVTAVGDATIAVWREAGSSIVASVTRGSGQPRTMVVAPASDAPQQEPAVAGAQQIALVVWTRQAGRGFEVLGRRVAVDGRLLDEAPITIGTEETSPGAGVVRSPAVASDGRDFLVVWIGNDIHLRRAIVSSDGHLNRNGAMRLAPFFGGMPLQVAVAWSGTEYLVVWLADRGYDAARGFSGSFRVLGARVTRDGIGLDSDQSLGYFTGTGECGSVAAVAVPNGAVAAWSMKAADSPVASITALRLTPEGAPVGVPAVVPKSEGVDLKQRVSAAAVRDRVVVVWSNAAGVAATELPGGTSTVANSAGGGDVAAVGKRFVAAYVKTNAGAARVFTASSR